MHVYHHVCFLYLFKVAVPDLAKAADGADILVFVVPHQFLRGLCKQLEGCIKKSAIGISLIKVSLHMPLKSVGLVT